MNSASLSDAGVKIVLAPARGAAKGRAGTRPEGCEICWARGSRARRMRNEARIMKFTIEITRGSSPRELFQRIRQRHRSAVDAITEAERLLQTLRAANPENPPEGYRVLDPSDKLV